MSGIPALIIVKPNGDLVTKNGRADVQVYGSLWDLLIILLSFQAKPPAQALKAWTA